MFTFITQENRPVIIGRPIRSGLYLLHPFNPKPTHVDIYHGDGMLASYDCFIWTAEHNIPTECQISDKLLMREAGWQLFFNTQFYQVERRIYFVRRPNPVIINTLQHLHSAFNKFSFHQLDDFDQIINAYTHKLTDYIPLTYPIKLTQNQIISYYHASPSKLLYC